MARLIVTALVVCLGVMALLVGNHVTEPSEYPCSLMCGSSGTVAP
jgi:hypothetical protein